MSTSMSGGSVIDAIDAASPQQCPALASTTAELAQRRQRVGSDQLLIAIVGGSHAGCACACSLIAAGVDPRSLAVFERSAEGRGGGAGVVADDLSIAFLKGLGVLDESSEHGPYHRSRINGMRVQEERVGTSGHRLARDDHFPAFSAYWADVHAMLRSSLPAGVVRYGMQLTGIAQQQSPPAAAEASSPPPVQLSFADGTRVTCELLIAADGPTSTIRSSYSPPRGSLAPAGWAGPMRFAGYFAWRGVISRSQCPPSVLAALLAEYPDFGNCLYFITTNRSTAGSRRPPRQHAVLYELGGELIKS